VNVNSSVLWRATPCTLVIRTLNNDTVELHLSGRWLSRSPIIRIGLAFRVILSRILQN